MSFISKIISRQDFHPTLPGIFTNPHFMMRRGLRKAIASNAHFLSGSILDIGCGNKPYKELFLHANNYIGMDYESAKDRVRESNVDIFYDGRNFPIETESFDSVLMTEVLEHVFNPDEFLSETRRILKTGGVALITTPFIWEEHFQPFDYARYSSFGLKHLLERNGFEIIKQEKIGGSAGLFFQLLNEVIAKKLAFRNFKLRLIAYIFTITPINMLAVISSKIFPRFRDLYLTNLIIVKKKRPEASRSIR